MNNVAQKDAVVSLKMSLGFALMALLDGGLFTLGVICMFLLSPKDRQPSRQHKILRGYIITLLLANFIYLAAYFLKSHYPLLYIIIGFPLHGGRIVTSLFYLTNILPVLILSLTDGLLVWRCYRVLYALGGSQVREPRRRSIFWVFPLFLWANTTVTGLVGACLIGTRETVAPILETTALVSNALANAFATCFIIVRLVLHRRMIIGRFGDCAPSLRHLQIASILLQSAAVNVPMAIIAAAGVAQSHILGAVAAPIVISCQSFCSILIIHQVALRRAIDEQKEGFDRRTDGEELTSGIVLSDHPTITTSV